MHHPPRLPRASRQVLTALAVAMGAALPHGMASAQATGSELSQTIQFDIPAQALDSALLQFSQQAGVQVTMLGSNAGRSSAAALSGSYAIDAALTELLRNTGFTHTRTGPLTYVVQGPQAGVPSLDEARRGGIEEVIVTGQKREERIRDVPIAISAFSMDDLDALKIEGGSELLRAIPNVNFSKSNFSMYNFSIRGVGTKAISASSDPAVAVSFNGTPLVRNRLFEAEFFDIERIEVLRGPQGTLYGRNATAGVVNLISRLPDNELGGELKAEVGNYSTRRLSGMVNLPMGEMFGLRLAGAWTQREGFDYNAHTQQRVNGRDLWSTRLSLAFTPSDRFRADLIWQHFNEDDDRARTGKQLCTRDEGPSRVGSTLVTDLVLRGQMSQGCKPGSLYSDAAYSAPNGRALTYVDGASRISSGSLYDPTQNRNVGDTLYLFPYQTDARGYITFDDPYERVTQSRNLREVATAYDPDFRATNDVAQLNLTWDPTDSLQLVSQTSFAEDHYYSTQDYHRFVSTLTFTDSLVRRVSRTGAEYDLDLYPGVTPGGEYCDPQLGCADRMMAADLSRSSNRQWSQEFRMQSSFDGPLNFSLGINYMDFKTQDNYYVFNNLYTMIADWVYFKDGLNPRVRPGCVLGFEERECVYVDRNPLDRIDNQGHNYFLSQNGVRIKSKAIFGELYWQLADTVKLTAGLRYTNDRKVSDQIPSQLLLGGGTQQAMADVMPELVGDLTGGRVNSGYPALDDIRQEWSEFTGRLVLDWKPDLSFTDDTLVYFSLARGYKGGGTNPPRVDFNPNVIQYQPLPQTFQPEYVNAFEVGVKNSFAGGLMTLGVNAFLYDYTDYQVSQIMDRIAFNENFDSTNWGIELEAAWRPTEALRFDANLGYLSTRLAHGAESVDVMDRTQGDPDWVLMRPVVQVPSSCIAPRAHVETILQTPNPNPLTLASLCPGADRYGSWDPDRPHRFLNHWSTFGITYDPLAPYDPQTVGLDIDQGGSGAPNAGRGFAADLAGNNLPNAPRWTFNLGAQYSFYFGEWALTPRADYYWQDKSYARVYNTEFDRLKAWDNVNVAVTLEQQRLGLIIQAYVKNAFDKAPITDVFVNADDAGLTANVFTLDPRLVGVSITKRF